MKKIVLLIACAGSLSGIKAQYKQELKIDQLPASVLTYKTNACTPSTSNISCNATSSFNISASGYVGNNPTAGDGGCNPCCYAGADLDCDGLQDVPFSVENSKWYKYCNTTAAAITITVDIDEPGTGSSCNLQGAAWVGSTLSAAVMDCGNPQYNQFDSNVGGAADGFTFGSMTVPAGECAWIMIDGYGGSTCSGAAISIICPLPLPISLINFKGEANLNENKLSWSTATETNNDYFTLERSIDGMNFNEVAVIDGAGTSNSTLNYNYADRNFDRTINYYRLKQTDHDRTSTYSSTIVIDNSIKKNVRPVKTTNLLGQEVGEDFEGIKLTFYSDGTVVKQFGK
jgi:hypothetical protein